MDISRSTLERCKYSRQCGVLLCLVKDSAKLKIFSRSSRQLEDSLTVTLGLRQKVLIFLLDHQRQGESPCLLRLPVSREMGLANVHWGRTH